MTDPIKEAMEQLNSMHDDLIYYKDRVEELEKEPRAPTQEEITKAAITYLRDGLSSPTKLDTALFMGIDKPIEQFYRGLANNTKNPEEVVKAMTPMLLIAFLTIRKELQEQQKQQMNKLFQKLDNRIDEMEESILNELTPDTRTSGGFE